MRSFQVAALALGGLLPFVTAAPVSVIYHNDTAIANHTTVSNHTDTHFALPVTGKYIVTLKQGLSSRDLDSHVGWVNEFHARSLNKRSTAGVDKTFRTDHFNGYAGEFDNDTLEQIRSNPDVKAVEEDQFWTLDDISHPESPDDLDTLAGQSYAKPASLNTQFNAPWGLARLAHKSPGATDYVYDGSPGQGTYAYLIDTGLYTDNSEFEGRATLGYNAVAGTADTDMQGHGTHTAGTIGGKTFGVAKSAHLIGVKVFDKGGGLTSLILDGFNWAVSDIKNKGRVGKAVINMSLGGGHSDAFNAAVQAAYDAGIVTVVAAGNQGKDVGDDSPASAPAAVTVGAVDKTDAQPSYSNYGKSVDIYAPGSNILSAGIGSPTATKIMSGTSMATPHVAGLVLYLMAKEGLTSPDDIVAKLKHLAIEGVVNSLGSGSPNMLAYNGA